MREYAITLMNDDGPCFNIMSDNYEIIYSKGKFDVPSKIVFFRKTENGKEIVGSVPYMDVHTMAEVTCATCTILDFKVI